MRLITFLLSLLLAVGWTDVSAQLLPTSKSFLPQMDFTGTGGIRISQGAPQANAPMREDAFPQNDMYSLTKAEADAITYTWYDENGKAHPDTKATEVASDPYQIYYFLREVYMNKAFPGPYTTAYTYDNKRENTVYYGGVDGGWEIPYKESVTTQNVPLGDWYSLGISVNPGVIDFKSVYVYDYDTNQEIAHWQTSEGSTTYYSGITAYTSSGYWTFPDLTYREQTVLEQKKNGEYGTFRKFARVEEFGNDGQLSLRSRALNGHKKFRVVINARNNTGDENDENYKVGNIIVNGKIQSIKENTFKNYTWTFTEKTIQKGSAYIPTDVLISTVGNDLISSISVKDLNSGTITSWNGRNSGLPSSWYTYHDFKPSSTNDNGIRAYYLDGGGVIRIPAKLFQGKEGVEVTVRAKNGKNAGGFLRLCNKYEPIDLTDYNGDFQEYKAKIYFPVLRDSNFYKPTREGYTAIVVSVKDDNKIGTMFNGVEGLDRASHFETKEELIEYFRDNINFVKLLTDGVRVGEGENRGTVFRCDGTYNKLFFLGKGRSRKKDDAALTGIGNDNAGLWPDWGDEQVPFHYMFEQFSPTSGDLGDDIGDFYTEMMDGKLYDIVHDCPSVIQNEHQFSMSGKDGTTAYGFTGLNFYIPDFRLKFFKLGPGQNTYNPNDWSDGRDMNPYLQVLENGNGYTGKAFDQGDHIGVFYARYNPAHAPKVGIYKITLDATVAPVADYDSINNANYNITLDWISSLDQMSGSHYPQHYYIYQVEVDKDGNETRKVIAEIDHDDLTDFNHYNVYKYLYDKHGNPVLDENGKPAREKIGEGDVTTDDPTVLTLRDPYPQQDYSQTFTFIVEGWPVNSDRRPTFFAWSNPDQVIIPGKSQFLSLHLDHYESDFIINGASDLAYMKNYRNSLITDTISGEHNYYRNFVSVNSEDVMHGLTIDSIKNGMHTFDMFRSTLIPKEPGELKIAQIVFDPSVATNAQQVKYNITYDESTQFLLANKFLRDSLNIPDEGYVRVKGNGDLVIQPSGYNVNFYSINVTRGNRTWSWTYTQTTGLNAQTKLPTGWYLSPGSMWVQDKPGLPYYLEGGGYIAIPNVLNGSNQAVTVTIKASGDLSTHSNILVDDRIWNITNGDAVEHTWTIPATAGQISPTLRYYEKITSVDQITDGARYLIVCETASPHGRTINGSLAATLNNWSNSADVTISGDQKITTEEGDMYYFTINKSGNSYTIKSKTGYYIGGDGSDASLAIDNRTAYSSNIAFDANGNVNITTGNTQMQYTEFTSTNNDWCSTFRYFTNGSVFPRQAIQLYKYVETTTPNPNYGQLRIGALHFVDQFKVSTAKDDHPYRYGYQLKEVKSGGGYGKASSMVEVPVQHTNSKVNGYFTLDSIDNDIYIKADTNLMTAEVVTELSATNSMVFFNTIQARRKQNPVVFRQYATILQQQTDFTYKEMKNPSSRFGKIYDPGIHHYFDSLKLTGKYADDTCKRVYIPSVMTRGIDRRYFADDTLHNTYGAPIYRTGVGKVELETATAVLMQSNYGGVEWKDKEGTTCNLFCLDNIKANGYLPTNKVSNVDYEPYMYRLYVKSANGKLRPYTKGEHNEPVAATIDPNDTTQTHGPLCVWSGYVKSIPDGEDYSDYGEMYGKQLLKQNTVNPNEKDYVHIYEKKKVNRTQGASWDKDKYNAFFGAVKDIVYNANGTLKDKIDPKDLTIYVRFYYIGKGLADGHTPRITHSNVPEASAPAGAPRRDGEAPGNGYPGPAGYPADSPGFAPGIQTAVNELMYQGEIVKTTYYNLQGMESSTPFDGLNIVVNRYSDGTTQALKVLY